MNKGLTKKIKQYLRRAENEGKYSSYLKSYPLQEPGYWMIMSGIWDSSNGCRERLNKVLHGKFIDAVAYAVQQNGFYGYSAYSYPGNYSAGYIEKVDITELETGIESLFKSSKKKPLKSLTAGDIPPGLDPEDVASDCLPLRPRKF